MRHGLTSSFFSDFTDGNSFEQGLHTFGILKQSTSLLEIVSLSKCDSRKENQYFTFALWSVISPIRNPPYSLDR